MRSSRRLLLAVLLGFAAAGQAGCCRQVRRYPVPRITELVGAVRKTNEHPGTMRAKVTADQRTKKGRLKATVYLLANRKGGLRMEATVLDNTVAVLTSDGRRFYSIDFKRKIVYLGPAKPCNIARIFGIPLRPGHVGLVLMGGMPLLKHRKAKITWDRCTGTEVLWLRNEEAGLEQKVWVRRTRQGWRVERSLVRDPKGRTLLSIRFRKFVRRSGAWMPTWIRYIQKGVGTDVLLRYKKVEADVEIPEDAYRIEAPEGYPVRWLDCRERRDLPFEGGAGSPSDGAKGPEPSATSRSGVEPSGQGGRSAAPGKAGDRVPARPPEGQARPGPARNPAGESAGAVAPKQTGDGREP